MGDSRDDQSLAARSVDRALASRYSSYLEEVHTTMKSRPVWPALLSAS